MQCCIRCCSMRARKFPNHYLYSGEHARYCKRWGVEDAVITSAENIMEGNNWNEDRAPSGTTVTI